MALGTGEPDDDEPGDAELLGLADADAEPDVVLFGEGDDVVAPAEEGAAEPLGWGVQAATATARLAASRANPRA
ncbi:hypothetical protein [Arthrobacter sp. fls2-241-R2A-200]|uniref:hypothetical protein n=1 Tax=Arthrobacter sp. fls2-241-R2A-200 TaxID=3040281 RepID=UPI003305B1A7